jgi:hypothetical protein
MSRNEPRFLSALRRWRRGVIAAALPALLVSALAGATCADMTAPHTAAVPSEHSAHPSHAHQATRHDAHAEHGQALDAAPASMGDCPHCLGGHAAANVAGSDCSVGAAPPGASFAVPGTLPGAAIAGAPHAAPTPAPPLIRETPPPDEPAAVAVPLRIRHCVLLI